MRVSIVIPLFNKQSTIERAVRSVLAQNFDEWELIVVDDGSSDNSLARLRTIADGRIRIISQPNLGPGAARNRGVKASCAELLAFLDADDEWQPNYLERLTDFLIADNTIAAVTCCYTQYPQARSRVEYWRARGIEPGTFAATAETSPELLLAQLAFMSPCTTIVRRAAFKLAGGFYEGEKCSYAEDAYLFLKILARNRVANVLEPLARLHFEDSNLSNARVRARQVEPFLLSPENVLKACSREITPLFKQVLALRAFKTSCVLSAWGRWQEARALRARFIDSETEHLKHASLSLLAANPLGSAFARIVRSVL